MGKGARMLSAACLERDNSVWKNCAGFSHLAEKIYVDQKRCVCMCVFVFVCVLKLQVNGGKIYEPDGKPFCNRGSPFSRSLSA